MRRADGRNTVDFCRTIAAALLAIAAMSAFVVAPASAQTSQQAQRQLFVCMQKANNLGLKDDKKDEFIKKCVEESEKPAGGSRNPT